jgi:diguanylate cyclase (GGDEF)-like protein/PAS domain S-box-containing protein
MDRTAPEVAALTNQLRKAQETIRDLEEKTRFILDSIHAGIIIIDAETHNIVDANPEALILMGIPKSLVVGKICHNFICPSEIGSCPITDKGQQVDNSERVLLTTDGQKIPILKTVASVTLNGRKHLLESFLDISQLKILQNQLEILATTDPLTGVFNRRHFIEMTEKEINRARRSKIPLSIAMIDIDNFKRINDTYGHTIGDQVLKELVAICNDNLRTYDMLGRLGGEEFAITTVGCALQEAYSLSDRLRERVANHLIHAGGKDISIKISIGVSELSGNMENVDSILNRADQALYLAKNAGRNRVEKLSGSESSL